MAMAETSAPCFSRLRFFSSASSLPSISRCRASLLFPLFSYSFNFSISPSSRHSSRLFHHIVAKASDSSFNISGDDLFGFFPWSQSDTGTPLHFFHWISFSIAEFGYFAVLIVILQHMKLQNSYYYYYYCWISFQLLNLVFLFFAVLVVIMQHMNSQNSLSSYLINDVCFMRKF